MDIRLALMCGTDIPVPKCQITLHQPSISEISFIGEEDFFIGRQCLCVNKNMFLQGKEALAKTSNFQIFMTMMADKSSKDKKIAATQVLELMIPGAKIFYTPRSLIITNNGDNITIDESNFEFLQDAFKAILCMDSNFGDQVNYNPGNEEARRIAQKLMRGRERVAAQKNAENGSVFSTYLSILSVGLNMELSVLKKLTMYQLYDLITRYGLYLDWDLDVRYRMAGAKIDRKPENWMKNLH